MNPCMAGLAQRHEVLLVMRPALCQWQLMVYFLHRPQQSFLLALLTERMLGCIAVTDTLPCPPIPTAYSRVAVVLLVAAVLLPLMLLTEPPFRQLRASGEGTRPLRFPWHLPHLLIGIKKAPAGFFCSCEVPLDIFSCYQHTTSKTKCHARKVDTFISRTA